MQMRAKTLLEGAKTNPRLGESQKMMQITLTIVCFLFSFQSFNDFEKVSKVTTKKKPTRPYETRVETTSDALALYLKFSSK